MAKFQLIGHGAYNVAEAARLTGVPRTNIRRWTQGYSYKRDGEEHDLPPVLGYHDAIGKPILTFADLVEVRVLDRFRKRGVPWRTLRIAASKAAELTGHPRPFSLRRFKTDGRAVLDKVAEGVLHDIVNDQQSFEQVLDRFLIDGLDFNESDEPERWWPLGKDKLVVIDPTRGFGTPICSSSGVPTVVVDKFYSAEQDVKKVMWWYDLAEGEVEDAVEFEASLAA